MRLRSLAILTTTLALVCQAGCDHPVAKALHPANVAHELRPHRLWRKNANRPLSENAYFSVPAAPADGGLAAPSPRDQFRRSVSEQVIGNLDTE